MSSTEGVSVSDKFLVQHGSFDAWSHLWFFYVVFFLGAWVAGGLSSQRLEVGLHLFRNCCLQVSANDVVFP